ncbi:MAG: 3-mercaptopyruvate sulfurtransferase [Proteobacteria bacterium]|nr:3-mercaptopyruvate sulfurtransferase [Pseudomonadota bacterium]
MDYVNPESLVSTEWLAANLTNAGVRIVDASLTLAGDEGRDAKAKFAARHIPGAVFFDIDEIVDGESALPHMMPDAETFAASVGALGIGNGQRVVVYDGHGLFSAGRAWWMFRAFGHDDVAILDGGFPKWVREDRAIESGAPQPPPARFDARLDPGMVRDFDQVLANIESRDAQVIDARGSPRFTASAPEPRAGLRGGHIPGSVNLPYPDLVKRGDGTLLAAPELAKAFSQAGADLATPVIATCGSGVTAAALVFALHLLGKDDAAVYDGSWSEWGGREDAPVET